MVDGQTVVAVTMKQLICSIAAFGVVLAGVLWGVLSFTIGGIRDDVRSIRDSVVALQKADRDNINRSRDIELKMVEQLAGLKTDFVSLTNRLVDTNKSVAILGKQVTDFQKEFSATVASYNDPGRARVLIEQLKAMGLDDKRIIVVPVPGIRTDPQNPFIAPR